MGSGGGGCVLYRGGLSFASSKRINLSYRIFQTCPTQSINQMMHMYFSDRAIPNYFARYTLSRKSIPSSGGEGGNAATGL
mmetsp:Transcript_13726/g.25762  ORF Transcript_13726/g.25762 Transcript_13726/m.25762 type:complete len:80 (-) Transcript_13726:39-278(-)